MRILIIDDEEIAVYSYIRYLTKIGYQVSFACSLQEANQLLQKENFDAVILDLRLPDGNALEMIPQIRSLNNETVIIIVSGSSDNSLIEKATQLGANRFLVKPVSMQKICASIVEILNGVYEKNLTYRSNRSL